MLFKILQNAAKHRKPTWLQVRSMASLAMGSTARKTKGEMFARQGELPKYPVPPLRESVKKYLESVKPFLTIDEFQETERLAEEFLKEGGAGESLHKILEHYAEGRDNWLAEWWLNGAYLGYRNPVVVYSSPAMAMPKQNFRSSKDQLAYAASLVKAVLDFKAQVDDETMSTEVRGKFPLDMTQYRDILGTHREPRIPLDELSYSRNSRHIVVVNQGNFYKVPVYSGAEQLMTDQILKQLQEVVADSHERGRGPQIGLLTSWHRDQWAESYAILEAHRGNKKSLDAVREAIIVLCIDDPLTQKAPWDTVSAHQLLVGGKHGENAANRWCDKTIQFIVGAEGNVGILCEHSPAEGPPVAGLLDFCVKQASIWPVPPRDSPCKPEFLRFDTNVQIQQDIERSKEDLAKLTADLDLRLFSFDSYGKNFIKSCKMSPDSFIQMALQLAFYRIHERPGACYETASLRKFLGGRTETIRSCSVESTDFCRTFLSDTADTASKIDSLRKAVATHKEYAAAANEGRGVDRLFFGMKMIAAELDIPIPDFFVDKGMQVSTHFRLSTSQVAAKSKSVMFYGPLVPDGYACCYNPGNEFIYFGLSSFKSCPATDLEEFRASLEKSLYEMRSLLDSTDS